VGKYENLMGTKRYLLMGSHGDYKEFVGKGCPHRWGGIWWWGVDEESWGTWEIHGEGVSPRMGGWWGDEWMGMGRYLMVGSWLGVMGTFRIFMGMGNPHGWGLMGNFHGGREIISGGGEETFIDGDMGTWGWGVPTNGESFMGIPMDGGKEVFIGGDG
jgi:hypothetical protein